jgi:DUF4097 and DUF4098 domain-containing protein YvlB
LTKSGGLCYNIFKSNHKGGNVIMPEKELSEKEIEQQIKNLLIDNVNIKELMDLGKQVSEKYDVDPELYEFFHREVVEV